MFDMRVKTSVNLYLNQECQHVRMKTKSIANPKSEYCKFKIPEYNVSIFFVLLTDHIIYLVFSADNNKLN